MEKVSNCCGARVDGLNADNIGICSECKEGCGVEEIPDFSDDKFKTLISEVSKKLSKLSEQKQ